MAVKALRAVLSGSYRNSKKEIIDFQDLEGIIPFNEEEVAFSHLRKRYAAMWIMKNPEKFKERLHSVREVFIDVLEEAKGDFSFIGKDIKQLTQDELQDLACCKDIRGIPVFRKVSLRNAQAQAYAAYSAAILDEPIQIHEPGFNFVKMRSIILDGKTRTDRTRALTNEEVIQGEQRTTNMRDEPVRTNLTREELIQIARERSIKFAPQITTDNLYRKVYPTK